jgi:pyrroline-5-carboxylate reductase
MPNTPAHVGAGVTAICPGTHAGREQVDAAATLLATVGTVVEVAEGQMDAVTAVSGSGPAYVFLVVEALVEAGVRAGLGRDLASQLVLATLDGSVRMLTQTGEHPAVLRERVTSPGGTTAAALHRLEAHGLRAAFLDAVLANRDRAREIAEGRG